MTMCTLSQNPVWKDPAAISLSQTCCAASSSHNHVPGGAYSFPLALPLPLQGKSGPADPHIRAEAAPAFLDIAISEARHRH